MDNEKLILLVQANECLYNKQCMCYKLTEKKKRGWQQISTEMKVPEDIVVKRWACLRDRYAREKRQETLPSGSERKIKSQWPLMQTMEFIAPYVVPRATRCSYNICSEAVSPSVSNRASPLLSPSPVAVSSPLPKLSAQTFTPIEISPTTPLLSKRKRHEDEDSSFNEAIVAFKTLCENRSKKDQEEEKGAVHGFGQMMVATICSMNAAKQVKAMQKLTVLLMEMKLEPDDE